MTVSLPVIVGFGGYNAAGRSSSHQAFRRMILDSLSPQQQQVTILGLACLMGHLSKQGQAYQSADGQLLTPAEASQQFRDPVLNGTLVRKIQSFDPFAAPSNKKVTLSGKHPHTVFTIAKRDLPRQLPDNWQLNELADGTIEVSIESEVNAWSVQIMSWLQKPPVSCRMVLIPAIITMRASIHGDCKWRC